MYSYNQAKAVPCQNIDGIMIKPPPRLSVQFLMQNKLPVWVLTAIPPQSLLTFTIKQGGGLPGAPLRISRSKYPQCITTDFTHDVLAKGGKDVWHAIDKGMLVVVWPSDAEVLSGGKVAEDKRVQLSKYSTLNTDKTNELEAHDRILRKAKIAEENADAESAAEQSDPTNSRVLDIVSRSKAGEVKLNAAVEEFEALEEVMTERDYQYAIANVRGGKLRAWLQEKLASGVAVKPAVKPKPKKSGIDTLAEIQKRSASAKVDDVFDSEEPEMTDEEREAEEMAAMMARQRQKI